MQARLERVDPSYLASSQINTPNIGGCCFAGEQVVVHWSLPSECSNLTGTFTVRYKDYTESTIDFAVRRNKGYWIYRLIGEGFCEKGGVLSYKAEIFANNALIAETRHHLYANTITLDEC